MAPPVRRTNLLTAVSTPEEAVCWLETRSLTTVVFAEGRVRPCCLLPVDDTQPRSPRFLRPGRDVGIDCLQLVRLRTGPGAAILPHDVTRIHMEFNHKYNDGHMGPRCDLPPLFGLSPAASRSGLHHWAGNSGARRSQG